jgi:hypothetical protein
MQAFLENLKYFKANIKRDREHFNGNNLFFALLDSKIETILESSAHPTFKS